MRRAYALGMVLLVGVLFIGAVVANASYTRHVAEQADRRQAEIRAVADARWCTLFALLDPKDAPPTTERGQKVADAIRLLRADFHCPKGSP